MSPMPSVKYDTPRSTYGEYLRWPDDRWGELIDGIAYVREPRAPSRVHQEWVGELYHQVRAALEGKTWRAYVAPFDVRLPKSNERDELIDTVVQPDVFVVHDLSKLDARGMRGAPDWLAEVLSPRTASHDQVVKLPVYERAGVKEVWTLQPSDRTLSIYLLAGGGYGRPAILELKGKTAMTAVPDVTIDWDRITARLV
jgi:Uma2 family endonuclease